MGKGAFTEFQRHVEGSVEKYKKKNHKKNVLIFQFVDVHMSSQINFSHEGHSAVIAGKWLKAFVFPTMCDQI